MMKLQTASSDSCRDCCLLFVVVVVVWEGIIDKNHLFSLYFSFLAIMFSINFKIPNLLEAVFQNLQKVLSFHKPT